MTKAQFLDALRSGLRGLPQREIDDLLADYAAHFTDGRAAGRSETDIAAALGDPVRLARELRAEAGFRRWESDRTPANLLAVLFGFVALVTVDFVFLLPLLGGLALFIFIAAIVLIALCIAGAALVMNMFGWWHGHFAGHFLSRALGGLGLLGLGIGGGAALMLMIEYLVRLLGKFARLHYALLNRAGTGGVHG